MIEIYSDGSCKKNPGGPGGWGFVAIQKSPSAPDIIAKHDYELCDETTNNREELKAMIKSLEYVKYLRENKENFTREKVIVYSDSRYVVEICNNWGYRWRRNGWSRPNNQPVENLDLVKKIFSYLDIPDLAIEIKKVPGHNGIVGNELADKLATDQYDAFLKIASDNNLYFKK